MGKLEYALFYIGACFASSAAHVGHGACAFPSQFADQPVVGASGPWLGWWRIYAVRYHRRIFRFLGLEVPALIIILGWLILQLIFGVVGLYATASWGWGSNR